MPVPLDLSLNSVQSSIRDIYARLRTLTQGTLDLNGRKVTNASPSQKPGDYVTAGELFVDDPMTFDVAKYLKG